MDSWDVVSVEKEQDPFAVKSIEGQDDPFKVVAIEDKPLSGNSLDIPFSKHGLEKEAIDTFAPKSREEYHARQKELEALPGNIAEELGKKGYIKTGAVLGTMASMIPTSPQGQAAAAASGPALNKAIGKGSELLAKKFPKLAEPITKLFAKPSKSPVTIDDFRNYYTSSGTPGEETEAEFIATNLDKFGKAYTEAAKKEIGSPNYISADLAKTVPVEGRVPFEPALSAPRHEGGSAYSKALYDSLLKNPETQDLPVLVSAGVSGAGKTSGIKAIGNASEYSAIYDTNLSSVSSAQRVIDKALESNPNRAVQVMYVDRDPIKAFVDGVFKRFKTHPEHRIVPIDKFVDTMGARDSIGEIYQLYRDNPRVQFRFLDNSGPKGTLREVSLETLPKWGYNKETARSILNGYINQQYKQGQITAAEREAFLGRSASEEQANLRPFNQQPALQLQQSGGETGQAPLNPNLTEPVLKRPITGSVADRFKVFFQEKPQAFDPAPEAMRLNRQMANLIRSEQVQVESIPAMQKYGLTNADKDLAAQLLEEAATFSGQTLNFFSQVRKAIPEHLLKDVPEVQPTGWDWLITKTDKALGSVANLWRASLVSQLKTAIRNAEVFGGRFSLKILDDAAQGVAETLTGKQPPSRAFGPAMEDVFALFKRITPEGRNRLDSILDTEPIIKGKLYASPVSDVAFGKYANVLNTFNRAQEFFTRNTVVDGVISGEMRRLGVKDFSTLPEAMRTQILNKAVDQALDLTMAATPKGAIAKGILKTWNEIPIVSKILQVAVYPFPRFLTNSVRAMYEYSPLGITRFLNPTYRAILTSKDPRAAYSVINKAALGSAMFATAAWLRNSKYAGEKWYELKPDPDNRPNTVVDIRPFNPILPTYAFIADAMKDPSKMENRDWIEGMIGINRIAGTTLFMTSMMSGMGPDNLKKAISELTGQFLGGFTVPFRTFKDFVAHFSKEERQPRETKQNPLSGPAIANLPFASRGLPIRESLTRPEPKDQENPLREQLTGLREYTKTPLEQEIDRLGIKSRELYPKTGVAAADNEINRLVGAHIEEVVSPILDNVKYLHYPDAVKKEFLKSEIGKLRAEATKYVFENRPDLLKQRAEKRVPKELSRMLKEGDRASLGALPPALKKQLEKLLLE